MASQHIQDELRRADQLRQAFERMIYAHGQCQPDERGWYLPAYWSLVVEHHVATVGLIERELHGSAAALLRPIVEGVIRGHLVLFCSDEVLTQIRTDNYRVSFGSVGKEIDAHFGLNTSLQDFLRDSSKILHSYAHGGILQVQRRFKGEALKHNYADAELIQLLHTATTGLFLLTYTVARQLGYEEDWKGAAELYMQWGKPGRSAV